MSAPPRTPVSDTFFTASPHWAGWIILYFFLASLLRFSDRLSARPIDRPLTRLGYYIAFVGVIISGFLLSIDLTRPLRFWHMLIQNHTGEPMFKPWVPMSVG